MPSSRRAHPTRAARTDGSAPVRLVNKGDGGQRIHAGLMDREMDYHYVHFSGGRSYAESLNVSWQLTDHCPLGGGL